MTGIKFLEHLQKKRGIDIIAATQLLEAESITAFTRASKLFDGHPTIDDGAKLSICRNEFAKHFCEFAEDEFYPYDVADVESLGKSWFDNYISGSASLIGEDFDVFSISIPPVAIDTEVLEDGQILILTESVKNYLMAFRKSILYHPDMPVTHKALLCCSIESHVEALSDNKAILVKPAMTQLENLFASTECPAHSSVLELVYGLLNTVREEYQMQS